MKKIILFAAFLLTPLFFANSADASVFINLTWTITSVTIPQRAAILNLPTTTEFNLCYAGNGGCYFRFEVANPSGNPVGGPVNLYDAKAGATGNFTFEHLGGGTSYTPRLRLASLGSTASTPTANCVDKSGYFLYIRSAAGITLYCPNPPSATAASYLNIGSASNTIYLNFPPITI
jgi:hypothetical protein